MCAENRIRFQPSILESTFILDDSAVHDLSPFVASTERTVSFIVQGKMLSVEARVGGRVEPLTFMLETSVCVSSKTKQ